MGIKKETVYFNDWSQTAGPRQHLKAAFLNFIARILESHLFEHQHSNIIASLRVSDNLVGVEVSLRLGGWRP